MAKLLAANFAPSAAQWQPRKKILAAQENSPSIKSLQLRLGILYKTSKYTQNNHSKKKVQMKTPRLSLPKPKLNFASTSLFLTAVLFLAAAAQAANFTTVTSQGSGANWTAAIWNPGPVSPSAGNTYECVANGTVFGTSTANTRLRNPATAGIQTFPGDSLTLNTNTEIRAKTAGAILDFPGVNGNPGLILKGGVLNPGDNAVFTITGKIAVESFSMIMCGDNGGGAAMPLRGFNIAGELSGSGAILIGQAATQVAQEVSSSDNPYTGDWIVTSGWLKGSAPGSLGTGNITVDPNFTVPSTMLNGTLTAGPAQVEVMYDLVSPGTLTVANGGKFILHQDCSFTGATIEGTPLETRQYLAGELTATFPNSFPAGTGSITVGPPPAPTGITVLSHDGEVDLQWNPVASAATYNIKRAAVSGGPYDMIAIVTETNYYADLSVVNGSKYYYVISSVNVSGTEGADSAQVIGSPNSMVTGLAATVAGKDVALRWDSYGGATGYTVKRATVSGGPYTSVGTAITGTSYTDTSSDNGQRYYYAVVAELAGGSLSGISAEAMVVTLPRIPALTVSILASTVAKLKWVSADTVVNQFIIEQASGADSFTQVASVGGSARTFSVTGLSLSGAYSFRIKAVNDAGESDYSIPGMMQTPVYGVNVNFANASFATNFPGYINDYGDIYGVRASGSSYGWDVDNKANARERNNANSADKRYDTFNHMQKPLPAGRVWEIAIPNGLYLVHTASGDATATDSVFQHLIEDVTTTTYTAAAGAWWGEFTNTVIVEDGRLTLNSGPSAANNKIAFIDIYAATPVPIAISQQPQAQIGQQNHALSLAVAVTNAPIPADSPFYGVEPIRYQWFHDGTPVAGATQAALSLAYPQSADAGSYYVVVSNYANVVVSETVAVTVLADTTAPAIVSVGSVNGLSIGVVFSEEVDTNDLANLDPSNYQLVDSAGKTYVPTRVTVRPGRATAVLTLDAASGMLAAGSFTVKVGYLADLAGQKASNLSTPGRALGLITADVGTLGVDYQEPAVVFTPDANRIEVACDGRDIWNNTYGMSFVGKQLTGDFNVWVRMESLFMSDVWTKGGLMAREDLSPGSRDIAVLATPVAGQNQFQTETRTDTGGAATELGDPNNRPKLIPYPNTWVRLQRQGADFITYYSGDGKAWTPFVTNTPATAYPDTIYVGLATTSHNTNLTSSVRRTLAVYRDLSFSLRPTEVTLTASYINGKFNLSVPTAAWATYTVVYKNALDEADWQVLTTLTGDDTVQQVQDAAATPMRFYRARIE
jgi:hypothetical protein